MSKSTSGIALCEHGVPVRIKADGTMLTVCRECYEWIKQLDTVSAPASPPKERT